MQDVILTFRTFAVDAGKLPPKGIEYLLLNGFSQSMTDAATSARAKVINEALAEFAKENDRQPNAAERNAIIEANADAIAAAEAEVLQRRFDAICDGTMTAGQRGGGPRKSPLEAYVWGRAETDAKTLVRDKGLKWPTGDDAKAIVEKVLAKRRKAYESDFAKSAKKADDLDDII